MPRRNTNEATAPAPVVDAVARLVVRHRDLVDAAATDEEVLRHREHVRVPARLNDGF